MLVIVRFSTWPAFWRLLTFGFTWLIGLRLFRVLFLVSQAVTSLNFILCCFNFFISSRQFSRRIWM